MRNIELSSKAVFCNTQKLLVALFFPLLIVWHSLAVADSFHFKPELKIKTDVFGDVKIVYTIDSRETPGGLPMYEVNVYNKEKLVAKLPGVGYQKIFASPDGKTFLGVSNTGLSGTAFIVFDDVGRIKMLFDHNSLAPLNYCEESTILMKFWFDKENPNVRFEEMDSLRDVGAIKIRDCFGNDVTLKSIVSEAYGRLVDYERLYERLLKDLKLEETSRVK